MESGRAYDDEARKQRAERILDAAAELLTRWGYKRLTMDDVATEAGIGKGTIYLHWKTREVLFQAVLQRELRALLLDLQTAVRDDPSNALPHRLGRMYYLMVMQRPLLRALFTLDLDVLGKLTRFHRVRETQLKMLRATFIQMLQQHGLVRADLPPDDLGYAFRTVILGFFLTDPLFEEDQPKVERKADLLGMILQRAFGVSDSPDADVARQVADHVAALLGRALEEENVGIPGFFKLSSEEPASRG